ncbi:TetR/AcrR family transcriptional regulator C-terminal ligand-binding domain-containing protein [Mycobacterium sp. 94-17]|uniref:TetR/AcrR family transcriptional regulator C-terminal ligand-binding domain-containing protein n=1 Tax=Mycobacterium sp. 94-17 TaxID=2986147 RepID=UPI002D1F2BED|nr:TetR/AcrR family transcriptional regulator C-terminal ligand-binding domain-containing protein [Mycobacterium sp. 94-17]MEB4208666.1 TetR/AcrR family transcriptional regulator C-terminal ligand-binding domain-containing protein [Mycobacterium sp. 94-17]
MAEAVMQAYARADFTLPDSGDTVEDLRAWMHNYAVMNAANENVALVRALAAAAAEDLRDRDTLYGQLTGRFHDALCQRLRTGVSRGQIRADADIEAAADALLGATLYRMLSVTTSVHETIGRYDGLLDILTNGLSSH